MTTSPTTAEKMTTLSVRSGTKRAVMDLKTAYMRRHGRTISDDKVVAALAKGRTVEDLPVPAAPAPEVKVKPSRRQVNRK
jgi:hypothetical protein